MRTYFTKIIKAGERQREFNFRKVRQGADIKVHVDVPDERGNRIYFHMHSDATGSWKTLDQLLPIWIQNAQDVLSTVIKEEFEVQ